MYLARERTGRVSFSFRAPSAAHFRSGKLFFLLADYRWKGDVYFASCPLLLQQPHVHVRTTPPPVAVGLGSLASDLDAALTRERKGHESFQFRACALNAIKAALLWRASSYGLTIGLATGWWARFIPRPVRSCR